MADDKLDDEERQLIEKHRAKRREERAKAESGLRVWLRNSAGEEAEVPYDKGRGWLQRTFGIDLDDDDVQDESGDGKDQAGDGKDQAGKVTKFGRRVS